MKRHQQIPRAALLTGETTPGPKPVADGAPKAAGGFAGGSCGGPEEPAATEHRYEASQGSVGDATAGVHRGFEVRFG